ncbi:hypothetical protein CAP35_09790 [Chitinophagaceae bacterium IBVUCB1]|nr:hypothetical protein CAP35_09790 [Chitinophagaceae bacterium IBVUCB1]
MSLLNIAAVIAKLRKKLKRALLARLLKGNNVACNVCGSTYSSFFPYLNRANAQCPNCGSLERTRLLYYFIQDKGLISASARLLHIAPEQCLYNVFKKQLQTNYLPADKFEAGYSYPPDTLNVDITTLPFEDASLDIVIAIHVLEHVQDDAKALSEIYRVLKTGGSAILQVPYQADREHTYEDVSITTPEARKQYYGQSDHVRIYGRDYIQRFLAAGFSMEYAGYEAALPEQIKERCVFKKEEIFLLRK